MTNKRAISPILLSALIICTLIRLNASHWFLTQFRFPEGTLLTTPSQNLLRGAELDRSFLSVNQERPSVDAVVTLALNGFRPKLLAHTLRHSGQWEKPIYVITDDPLASEKEKSYEMNDVTYVFTENRLPKFDTEEELEDFVDFKQTNFSKHYFKWFKTQVFEYLPPDVESVLFMDADIAVQSPMEHWVREAAPVLSKLQTGECDIGIYREIWFSGYAGAKDTGKWNSGIMLLHRKSSRDLLSVWGRRIVSKPYCPRDQGKLTDAMESLASTVCSLPRKNTHLMMEQNIVDQLWQKLGFRDPVFRHLGTGKKLADLEKTTIGDER